MNKLFFPLSVFLFLVHGLSMAQKPGDVRWVSLTDPSANNDAILSIKAQADGKIVAAGNSYQGSYTSIVIGRFDGAILDSSFGTNGIVTLALDSSSTEVKALEIQADGKIVIAGGYYNKITGADFLLARYNTNGSPDSSFGIDGLVLTDLGAGLGDQANALTIQPDGKIIAGGISGSASALCRYDANGFLDKSFDLDGMLIISGGGAICLKSQKDGRILFSNGAYIARLQPDGSLDNSFGTKGSVLLSNTCNTITIQSDGKILVATTSGFALERFDAAGVHDNSFGDKGKAAIKEFFPSPTSPGGVTSICVQADGRILAAGAATYLGGNGQCFAVARFQSNGVPDSSFGIFGTVASSALPNFYRSFSYSAAISNNSEIVLAGFNSPASSPSQWALVSYYLGPLLDVPTIQGIDRKMIIVPNPVGDIARIQSKHLENGTWHLSLCDFTGKTLYTETVLVTNNALDRSVSLIALPPAMYLVKLSNGISSMTVKLTKDR